MNEPKELVLKDLVQIIINEFGHNFKLYQEKLKTDIETFDEKTLEIKKSNVLKYPEGVFAKVKILKNTFFNYSLAEKINDKIMYCTFAFKGGVVDTEYMEKAYKLYLELVEKTTNIKSIVEIDDQTKTVYHYYQTLKDIEIGEELYLAKKTLWLYSIYQNLTQKNFLMTMKKLSPNKRIYKTKLDQHKYNYLVSKNTLLDLTLWYAVTKDNKETLANLYLLYSYV
jgi:hypothetical protein